MGSTWDEEALRGLRIAAAGRDGAAVVAASDRGAAGAPLHLLGDALLAVAHQRVPGTEAAMGRVARLLRERGWEGDAELADELDAFLGEGPVPSGPVVPVDFEELATHLDGLFDEGARLDVRTGEIWPTEPLLVAGLEPPPHWEDDDRWVAVYPIGSGPAYGDMVDFAATVADPALADRLERALHGKGAFRRFKDIVFNDPTEGPRWRVFADERDRGRARAWLVEQGLRAGPARVGPVEPPAEGATIAAVLTGFLEVRRAAGTATEHDDEVVAFLVDCLDGYGHTHLSPDELAVLDAAEDKAAFTDLFGPEKIPLGVADLLGWYLLRKVLNPGAGLLAAAGAVSADLLRWLVAEGLVDQAVVDGAAEEAAESAETLPRAERLADLLYEVAESTSVEDLEGADPDTFIDDYLPISQVEPGKLWFDGLGPVEVPEEASQLAEVGWEANVVLASTTKGWRLVETGNVYP